MTVDDPELQLHLQTLPDGMTFAFYHPGRPGRLAHYKVRRNAAGELLRDCDGNLSIDELTTPAELEAEHSKLFPLRAIHAS